MSEPRVVTFDCYGTLVQWHEGLQAALDEILMSKDPTADLAGFAADFHRIRHGKTGGGYMPYRQILAAGLAEALAIRGLGRREEDETLLFEAVLSMEPFPEVPKALAELRKSHKIAIISNSDRDLIAGSVANIGVPFDWVFVAEDVGAYKPSHDFFRYALREIGRDPADIVHVGASMELDMEPASALGLHRVWMNRRGQPADARWMPYTERRDLAELPAVVAAFGQAGPVS